MRLILKIIILLVLSSISIHVAAHEDESKYLILRESTRYINTYLPDSVYDNVFSPKSISHSEIDKIFQSDSIIVIFMDLSWAYLNYYITISNRNINDILTYYIHGNFDDWSNYTGYRYIIRKDEFEYRAKLTDNSLFESYLIHGDLDIPDFVVARTCIDPSYYICQVVVIRKDSSCNYEYKNKEYYCNNVVKGFID